MKTRIRRSVAIAAGALALTFGLISGGPAFAAAPYPLYDGTDPSVTGCSVGASTIASYPIKTPANVVVGTMEIRYSPTCDTNWIRSNNTVSGTTMWKTIERYRYHLPQSGTIPYFSQTEVDGGLGWTYGMQADGASMFCINALSEIKNSSGAVIATSGTIWVC